MAKGMTYSDVYAMYQLSNGEKQSVPIMTRLYARAKTMSKDMELMSNSLMRKAVNYLLNQWNRLRNFILDGRVQISNLSGRIHRTSV
ncbi:MAG: transposase, partial [Clostridiaceae bacterium]|nr:transposase [Clostridiaceae bacterium]